MRPPSSILPLLAAVGITVAAPFNPEIKWGGDGWTGRKVAVHFPANIPESLIRHAAYAATDYDSWVFDFHMDKGHDKYFISYLTFAGQKALLEALGPDVPVAFQTTEVLIGDFCPETFCKSGGQRWTLEGRDE